MERERELTCISNTSEDTPSSIYTEEYLNELKSSTPVRPQPVPEKAPEKVPAEVIVQDEDIIMLEQSEESDGFIPLDPETIAEEKDLLESRLYNEFDLEGEFSRISYQRKANKYRGCWI